MKVIFIRSLAVSILVLQGFIGLPAAAQTWAVAPSAGFCPQLTYNLYIGVSDYYTRGQVTQLQQFLSSRGYYQPVSGFFGSVTYRNVVSLQRSLRVYPLSGGVGPLTRAAIFRTCSGTPVPVPVPQGVTVTSPTQGQNYTHGAQMAISWSGPIRQTFAYEQQASIIDLYSVQTGKIGTIAIQNGLSGSFTWSLPPFPNNLMCTAQYPNGLCGVYLPAGQYYIEVSAVIGSGFDNSPAIATGKSGVFSIY